MRNFWLRNIVLNTVWEVYTRLKAREAKYPKKSRWSSFPKFSKSLIILILFPYKRWPLFFFVSIIGQNFIKDRIFGKAQINYVVRNIIWFL